MVCEVGTFFAVEKSGHCRDAVLKSAFPWGKMVELKEYWTKSQGSQVFVLTPKSLGSSLVFSGVTWLSHKKKITSVDQEISRLALELNTS